MQNTHTNQIFNYCHEITGTKTINKRRCAVIRLALKNTFDSLMKIKLNVKIKGSFWWIGGNTVAFQLHVIMIKPFLVSKLKSVLSTNLKE